MNTIVRLFHFRSKPQKQQPAWDRQQPAASPLTEQRAYLPDAPYLLPKDALEDQRLNYQHHVLYKTISNHYLAPITQATATTILDVGTGTGIWPAEMSALF